MCWKCKKNTEQANQITRNSECPICGFDLHTCLNCKFYDKNSHYECHETIDELVKDKERRNFCENFSLKMFDSETNDNSSKKALDAFNSLFGGN